MFPVSDLPQLSKGKGIRLSIFRRRKRLPVRDPGALVLLPPQSTLTIHVGKRKIKLRPEELQKSPVSAVVAAR